MKANEVVSYGFMDVLTRTKYQTPERLAEMRPSSTYRTVAMLKNLDVITGKDSRCMTSIVKKPKYNVDNSKLLERWLQPGDVSIVKNGCRIAGAIDKVELP